MKIDYISMDIARVSLHDRSDKRVEVTFIGYNSSEQICLILTPRQVNRLHDRFSAATHDYRNMWTVELHVGINDADITVFMKFDMDAYSKALAVLSRLPLPECYV